MAEKREPAKWIYPPSCVLYGQARRAGSQAFDGEKSQGRKESSTARLIHHA